MKLIRNCLMLAVLTTFTESCRDHSLANEEVSVSSLQTQHDENERIINDSLAALKSRPQWKYSETEDKMNSSINYFAIITAPESLKFDFPYDGGSYASFVIRKQSKSTDCYLKISKGQFNSSFDGGTARIKFDDDAPKTYSFSGASDASSDVVFFDSEKALISKIKKSKTMLIEIEFFNEGFRQIEFPTAGLEWSQ